jgi:hypothetical protein
VGQWLKWGQNEPVRSKLFAAATKNETIWQVPLIDGNLLLWEAACQSPVTCFARGLRAECGRKPG